MSRVYELDFVTRQMGWIRVNPSQPQRRPDGPANIEESDCSGILPCGGSEEAWLHISIESEAETDPRSEFETKFNEWRADHECVKRGPGPVKISGAAIATFFLISALGFFGIIVQKNRRLADKEVDGVYIAHALD